MSYISHATTSNATAIKRQTSNTVSIVKKPTNKNIDSERIAGLYDIPIDVKEKINQMTNKLPKSHHEEEKQLKELLDKVK